MPRLSVADCEIVVELLNEKISSILDAKQTGSAKYINVRKRLQQRLATAKKAKETDECE